MPMMMPMPMPVPVPMMRWSLAMLVLTGVMIWS